MITHRLSGDSFAENGNSKFSEVSSGWSDLQYICSSQSSAMGGHQSYGFSAP